MELQQLRDSLQKICDELTADGIPYRLEEGWDTVDGHQARIFRLMPVFEEVGPDLRYIQERGSRFMD